ncbi:hypothetical protein BH10PSE6_BH10PSE6_11970 [soil metagenome]
MKTCPFCKEQVIDDAIKCRYCQSMLLPVQGADSKPADDSRVTYILDRDLVRFGKFVGAVLAVFLVAGAYLFGFKLDSALDKVRSSQDELKSTHEKLSIVQRDLEAAQTTVKVLKRDVEALLNDAKKTLFEISEQKAAAVVMVSSIRELSPLQRVVLQEAKAEQPEKIRRGSPGKYWANGTTLRILFLDGDEKQRDVVRRAVEEWGRYANLKLEFVNAGPAEIRVSFKQPGSWSYLGTDALAVPEDKPTINLSWAESRNALHEFGHALGLIEEHLNPKADLKWTKDEIYRILADAPNYWTRAEVDRNVFRQYSEAELGPYRDFDPMSIMTMSMPARWTGGVALGDPSGSLSNSDKSLIARLYPKQR